MLWEVVPQPNGAWEEGVEMGIDRGLGDLEIKVVVSGSSAEGGKVIKRYVDGPLPTFK